MKMVKIIGVSLTFAQLFMYITAQIIGLVGTNQVLFNKINTLYSNSIHIISPIGSFIILFVILLLKNSKIRNTY
jgi:hypothetical protein